MQNGGYSPRAQCVNSSPLSTAYMRQWTGSTLLQVMACRLFGSQPLPEPMMTVCQLDPQEQTSVKLESKYKTLHSWKCSWKCHLRNGGHFCRGGDESNYMSGYRLASLGGIWSLPGASMQANPTFIRENTVIRNRYILLGTQTQLAGRQTKWLK